MKASSLSHHLASAARSDREIPSFCLKTMGTKVAQEPSAACSRLVGKQEVIRAANWLAIVSVGETSRLHSLTRREGYRGHCANPSDANSKSIRLAFVRANVAAGGFPSPGTRQAALVGLQKVPCKVTAAGGIARVECRAPFLQRHRLS